ncbi:hypothetical protein SLA2020_263800 [Shorea laevis]
MQLSQDLLAIWQNGRLTKFFRTVKAFRVLSPPMIRRQPSPIPYVAIFLPKVNHLDLIECIQQRHASLPFVLHPDKFAYLGKSFTVHINAPSYEFFFSETSKVGTPSAHNSFNYDIMGSRYLSIFIPGELGLGIIMDNMKYGCFMHNHGGKLYGTNITGQVLWDELMFPKELKLSDANPSLTLRGFEAKSG